MKKARGNQTVKELTSAIYRIQKGRPVRVAKEGLRLSISSVAREAGLTPAAIHNRYPQVAEKIRALLNKDSRVQRDNARAKLAKARQINDDLREEVKQLKRDLQELASQHATVVTELEELRAIAAAKNVRQLRPD